MKARVKFSDPERRMNKQEAEYAQYLEWLKQSGEILHWSYETIKLRLADRTWYTPDFFVIPKSSMVELHEFKGFWRDDSRVKIKVAAEQYPMFRFKGITRRAKERGGGYEVEEFS